MFVSEAIGVNSRGNLSIGGCDCIDLAKKYGTPLYILDEQLIRKNCRRYIEGLNSYLSGNGIVLYASKALCCMAVCEIVMQEGLGLDVSSGGELFTAKAAGFPMQKIYFHGNNKTEDEIRLGIDYGIGRFVVDNVDELTMLNRIAGEKQKKVYISFRTKPGIEANTHDFVQTGKIDSKFGFALENGEALDIAGQALKMDNVIISGLHCHIGSQIFELAPFELASKVMLEFMATIKKTYGIEIQELNLGGGFGIKYVDEHDPIDFGLYIKSISNTVMEECSRLGLKMPRIALEPGRSIIASAGITLYSVGTVKKIENVRTYVSIDGGMADNPRYALYEAQYDAVIVDRPKAEKTNLVTIAGRSCESDILIKDILMPDISAGDILAVLTTGAYNYSMSSNYNRVPKPPVILAKDGKSAVIVAREDYEDIIRNDMSYPF